MNLGPIFRSMRHNRVRFGLVIAEIALTLAVGINCAAMILDARAKMNRKSGLDEENLLSVRIDRFATDLADGAFNTRARVDLDALRAMPGVRDAAATRFLPWAGGGSSGEFRGVGSKLGTIRSQVYAADEHLLATLGTHVAVGRNVTRDDVAIDDAANQAANSTARPRTADGRVTKPITLTVLVSRGLARLVWGELDVLGRQLEDGDGDRYTIVGVVDAFYNPYGSWPIEDYAIFYAGQSPNAMLVRTQPGQRAQVARDLESRLLAIDPNRSLTVTAIPEAKRRYLATSELVVVLMGGLIVLLILVTALGVLGLTSYIVTERTRQFGTRRALGARRIDILNHVLLENWLLTTVGISIGLALAVALNVVLVSKFGASRISVLPCIAASLLLWIVGLGSALAPARRAARTAPAVATRNV